MPESASDGRLRELVDLIEEEDDLDKFTLWWRNSINCWMSGSLHAFLYQVKETVGAFSERAGKSQPRSQDSRPDNGSNHFSLLRVAFCEDIDLMRWGEETKPRKFPWKILEIALLLTLALYFVQR